MVVARGGEVEFQVFEPSRPHRHPLVSHAGNDQMQAILMGRLYYRRELWARLTDATKGRECPDDASLALAAYHAFGLDGIERLEGDFALVLWDRRQGRLVASREAMGGYPVYWLHQGNTVAFATGLRPLVDLLPGNSLNLEFLGELLMLPGAEIDYFDGSVFQGINRLAPGWSISADLRRGAVRQHEFWNWSDRIEDPGADCVEEIAQRYGELLRQAVRERLKGCMAAHCSGGMDSTSVALLAREQLVSQGQSLHALSLVYGTLSNLGGETPYLERALNRPGLVPHRIPADDILDYDAFPNMPLHDEPISGVYRAGLEMALLGKAAEVGADTVFTGLGADEMLATPPYYLADLLKGRRLWSAWSEASRWARAQNCSIWSILRPYGSAPLMPAWAQAGFGPLLRGGYAGWKEQNFWTIAPWVLPDFARAGQLRQRALRHVRRSFHSSGTVVQSEALAQARYAAGDWVRYTLAAPQGIVAAHPFRDLRVMSYGLGIRSRVRPAPGLQKPILAEAMRDVLPDSIRQRRSKTHYNSVYYVGLARNRPYLEALVRASKVDELGLFDKECLLRCLTQAALCIGSPDGAVSLDNSLSIVKWLSLLPRWLAQRPVPSRVIRSERWEALAGVDQTR
jgi:asparagine synthase (glutamine-hydrolysing)